MEPSMYLSRTLSNAWALHLSSLVRNCAAVSAISQAKQCHAQIVINGFLPNISLETDLLLLYSRCGILHHAREVFDRMVDRNMHSWNIMLTSYINNSFYSDAVTIYQKFRRVGYCPDHYTFPQLFKLSAGIGDIFLGKMFHSWVIMLGFANYVVVGSSILELYVKFGFISDGKCVFSNMLHRDIVAWNLMISGLGRAGLSSDAMCYFREMLSCGFNVDYMTVPSILNTCGKGGDLMKGKELHAHVTRRAIIDIDSAIGNALIDMYGKCGCLSYSEKVFQNMGEVNLVTWTTMISCYGLHGRGKESLVLFKKMIYSGLTPNSVTLTAILASCSHSGMIDQGRQIFNSIHLDHDFEPTAEHYACMVDLLGRCGHVVEALQLIRTMKSPVPASVWGALLSGCVIYRNVEIGEIAAGHLFQIEPKNTSNFISLCNIYESNSMMDGVSQVRARMRGLALVKTPGCSWITIAGRVHIFYQGHLPCTIAHSISELLHNIGSLDID